MPIFRDCLFSRDQAVALALASPGGCQDWLLERSTEAFGISSSIGQCFYGLSYVCGDSVLADLFRAAPEGAELAPFSPLFSLWLVQELTVEPPGDFAALAGLRAAAIEACVRRLFGARAILSPAQLARVSRDFAMPAARKAISSQSFEAFGEYWKRKALAIRAQSTVEPEKWQAMGFAGAVGDSAGMTAMCLSGFFGGDKPQSAAQRIGKMALTMLAECPVLPAVPQAGAALPAEQVTVARQAVPEGGWPFSLPTA